MQNSFDYLCGILDGEGSFGVWSKGKDKSPAFRMQVEMGDGDVVLKFLQHFKAGSITIRVPKEDKHKLMYHWRVNGDEAKNIVRSMLPLLSKRRQEQFHNAA